MLAEIKKCADKQDIKGLRYIFVDSLDVDPTFEKYKADYEYCKSLQGLFEKHQDLHELNNNESKWTLDYWEQLKLDLMKNFSEKRFEHMIRVARVVYAEKIKRIVKEREHVNMETSKVIAQSVKQQPQIREVPKPELENQRIIERPKKLEEHNQVEAEQKATKERTEAAKQAESAKQKNRNGGYSSKKIWGVVLAVVAVVLIILIVVTH